MKRLHILLILIAIFATHSLTIHADNANERQARHILNQAYDLVFGANGCSLDYNINIVGLYKSNGHVWFKNGKSKSYDANISIWDDGKNYYAVRPKKKTVTIHNSSAEIKENNSDHFTFNLDDFTYNIKNVGNDYLITMKAKPGKKGIKLAKIYLDRRTRAPKNLKLKVLWFWTTIKINNFRAGGINDNIFKFPQEKYKSYTIIDKRKAS